MTGDQIRGWCSHTTAENENDKKIVGRASWALIAQVYDHPANRHSLVLNRLGFFSSPHTGAIDSQIATIFTD
jgi:hypothetical protein